MLEQETSQYAVEIERGHRTNEREIRKEHKELATAHNSSMQNGKLPMIIRDYVLLPTYIDEPMDLDALSALEEAATNYIDYSKAMKAATPAPPRGTGLYVPSIHSSALPYVCSFLELRPCKWLLMWP